MSKPSIHEAAPLSKRSPSTSFPVMRLSETNEQMTIVALVPGFTEADLDISLAKDVLCVSGRCRAAAPGGFSALRRGRPAADFSREIKLLAEVACSDPEAQLERGVLTIRLRKDVPSSRPPIPIRFT